jgi:hypothetical protein
MCYSKTSFLRVYNILKVILHKPAFPSDGKYEDDLCYTPLRFPMALQLERLLSKIVYTRVGNVFLHFRECERRVSCRLKFPPSVIILAASLSLSRAMIHDAATSHGTGSCTVHYRA